MRYSFKKQSVYCFMVIQCRKPTTSATYNSPLKMIIIDKKHTKL